MIDDLIKSGKGPLLVVDADANSNLNEVLGVEAGATLGEIREEMAQAELPPGDTIPSGMTKGGLRRIQLRMLRWSEEDDFDMLVMGRTQGKGCYCYVNGVLKTQVDKYVNNYKYMVIDNEAGMEHIARGTLPHVDTLLLVSDCSRRGVQAVARIAEMVSELELKPDLDAAYRQPCARRRSGRRRRARRSRSTIWSFAGVLPQDEAVYEADCDGKPSSKIPVPARSSGRCTVIMQDLSLVKQPRTIACSR